MRIITSSKYLADHSNEWFSKNKPDWFKKVSQSQNNYYDNRTNFCPSFVELFKNTFVFCAPVEMMIISENEDYGFISADREKFVKITGHSFADQLDTTYAEKYYSLKLSFPVVSILSDKVESVIFMPSEYHFSDLPFQAMIGVLETIPNKAQEVTFNFKVDIKAVHERKEWLISKGTPLAYCYFPNGTPKEVEYVSKDEYESSTFIQTEFKCQYLRELSEAKKSLDK